MKHHLYVALASFGVASGSVVFSHASALPMSSAVSVGQKDAEPTWEALAVKFGGTKADTKPCQDSPMAFTIPVEVREVLVRGGEVVKKGELLIRARDDEQEAVVAGQQLQASNRNRIMNAELQKELADMNFNRIKEAMAKGGANQMEFDQRRIEASAAAIAVEQEKTTHEMEKKRLAQAEGLLERYRLTAPFDGIVEEVRVEEGQGVRESDPVVRLVNIQRLRLDAYASTPETIRLRLAPGSPVWVLVALPDKPLIAVGKVVSVSPVADSVSQTRRVHVEIENTEAWPAGTPAMVRFTDPGAEWSSYKLVSSEQPISREGVKDARPVKDAAGAESVSDAR